MTEKVFAKDLIVDTFIDSPFLLQSVQVRQKKNGEDFMSLVFKDRTGEVPAVMWDNVDEARDEASIGDYVQVTGKVGQFNDRPQLTVQRIKRLAPEAVNEEDFVVASGRDRGEMWKEFMAVVNSVGHLHLRRLLLDIFEDEEIRDSFMRAPAAKGHHHTFLGGLLEHTLSIVGLCEKVAEHYPWLDRDMLVTGGILHDLEKIHELEYERVYEYSDEGKLLGHIVMGAIDLDRRMREQEFPEKLRIKVLHMIISHHGTLEFGSPREPMTAEAMALHFIDMLDSRLEMVRETLENEKDLEGSFTSYHRGLGRSFYKG